MGKYTLLRFLLLLQEPEALREKQKESSETPQKQEGSCTEALAEETRIVPERAEGNTRGWTDRLTGALLSPDLSTAWAERVGVAGSCLPL